LLSDYGRALALVADATPAERARALQLLLLDEATFAALGAEGDAAIKQAIDAQDVAQLLAFKTSFDAGRATVEKDRAAKAVPVPPPVAAPVPPPPVAPLYVVRAPPSPVRQALPPTLPFRAVASTTPRGSLQHAAAYAEPLEQTSPYAPTIPSPSRNDSHIALLGSQALDEDAPETAKRPEALEAPAEGLSLMQYAALRADVLASPDPLRPAVFARYGLTAETDLEEAARWNARFHENRALFEE